LTNALFLIFKSFLNIIDDFIRFTIKKLAFIIIANILIPTNLKIDNKIRKF